MTFLKELGASRNYVLEGLLMTTNRFRRCVAVSLWFVTVVAVSTVPAKETTGLVPLTELGEGLYKEQTGVLYGRGQNVPPESHLKAAQEQTALIVPRDAQGNPSGAGKIVLISLGMTNTTQEFSVFKTSADADPNKSP